MKRLFSFPLFLFLFLLSHQLQGTCTKGADEFAKVVEREMDGTVVVGQIDGKGAVTANEISQNAGSAMVNDGKVAGIGDSSSTSISGQEGRSGYVSMDTAVARSRIRNNREANLFKINYAKSSLDFDNRVFMSGIDNIPSGKKTIYFDVENSVLKKLNDDIFEQKDLADSAANLFNKILFEKLQKNPLLSGKLEGKYRDFKSLRFRFLINEGEDSTEILKALKKLYAESATDFERILNNTGLKPLWAEKSGQLGDPQKWFLAGVGETPLEANMAARQGRGLVKEAGSKSELVEYSSRLDNLAQDIRGVEKVRVELQGIDALTSSKIMVRGKGKKKVLAKDAISILRKTKRDDYKTVELYEASLKLQFKKLFGVDIESRHLEKMTKYFENVDSLSPPLFVRNRTGIDLGQSENGLVSVDFTGVGVENAYEAMIGLAKTSTEGSSQSMVGKALVSVDEHVENVTEAMNKSKRAFNNGTKKVTRTRKPAVFSGDDGIYFPDSNWTLKDKEKLVRTLGRKYPSKYRVTFVETKYPDGVSIPSSSRSEYIVRAEKVEKEIRQMVTGVGPGKISPDQAKKMIIAIDYRPAQASRGEWNVLIGGKANKEQNNLINLALEKIISDL